MQCRKVTKCREGCQQSYDTTVKKKLGKAAQTDSLWRKFQMIRDRIHWSRWRKGWDWKPIQKPARPCSGLRAAMTMIASSPHQTSMEGNLEVSVRGWERKMRSRSSRTSASELTWRTCGKESKYWRRSSRKCSQGLPQAAVERCLLRKMQPIMWRPVK